MGSNVRVKRSVGRLCTKKGVFDGFLVFFQKEKKKSRVKYFAGKDVFCVNTSFCSDCVTTTTTREGEKGGKRIAYIT